MTTRGRPSLSVLVEALRAVQRGATADDGALVRAADRHGLGGLLYEAAAVEGASTLTQLLHDNAVGAIARESVVGPELGRVADRLARSEVRALVVKGAALAYAVYDSPWQRPRIDTDLLVDAGERDKAASAIEALGYTRSHAVTSGTLVSSQYAFERNEASGLRHVIDLHWQAVNPRVFADALPFDDLWRRRQSLRAPVSGWTLDPVSALQLAAVHRVAHHQGNDRLIWLYDVHLLAVGCSTGEWDRLAATAIERQIAGICADSLRTAAHAFGTAVPVDTLAALERAAQSEPSRRYLQGPIRRRDVLLQDLERLPSLRARLMLLREHAFPPAAFMRSRYQVHNSFWLPALYAHRLLTGAYRWIRA
jgi:hypothetical protein